VPELELLHAGHAPAVLAFELVNRAYFAASVSDRGGEFFDQFPDRYSALLAEQEAGSCAFYVLVAEDGSVLQVLQKGYRLGDKVIRPARVIVAQ
jgi:ribosomal-protein-alanine N-acetyltransferase